MVISDTTIVDTLPVIVPNATMGREVKPLTLEEYQDPNGRTPFREWMDSLEMAVQARVDARLERLKQGNPGDWKTLKNADGVNEIRIDVGPGYRIYFGRSGATIVILLCGGTKRTQGRDIQTAQRYWKEYKEAVND